MLQTGPQSLTLILRQASWWEMNRGKVIITVDSAFCQEATFLLVERLQTSYIRKITFCFSICSVYPQGKVSILIFSYLIPILGLWEFSGWLCKQGILLLQFKVLKKPTNLLSFIFMKNFLFLWIINISHLPKINTYFIFI